MHCDSGTRSRSRACSNPIPLNGGDDCSGYTDESEDCNTNICPGMGHKVWGCLMYDDEISGL